jgi:hypothetical protein
MMQLPKSLHSTGLRLVEYDQAPLSGSNSLIKRVAGDRRCGVFQDRCESYGSRGIVSIAR